ncbi:MAG: hypothetical protein JKY56_03195 [Kofleriaceae bacterium]|nr:hypothetical protein [Kofleriaceae bacterium]
MTKSHDRQTTYSPSIHKKKMVDDAIAESVAKRDRIRSLTKADLSAGAQGIWGYPLSWWLDMRSYNPTEVARTLDVPLLILYGEKRAGQDCRVVR